MAKSIIVDKESEVVNVKCRSEKEVENNFLCLIFVELKFDFEE